MPVRVYPEDEDVGQWLPLALVAAMESNPGTYPATARLELESVVRLRSLLRVKAGKEIVGGKEVFKLPSQLSPSKIVLFIVGVIPAGGGPISLIFFQVETTGEVRTATTLTSEQQIIMDHVSFSIR